MKTARVQLGKRSYDVVTGKGILEKALRRFPPGRGFLLADARLKPQAARIVKLLRARGWELGTLFVPAREELKDFKKIYPIYGKMLEARLDRSSTLFALGGGTIGDAAGFLAATFLRGIKWVGIPTTLLAQVDSAIGGKTGVNHEAGKNLIGAFHQPALVINELSFLSTLDKRDRISGLGELIKYGFIYDRAFFKRIERDWKKLLALEPSCLGAAIADCVQFKARAVEADEEDRAGIREVLNFGHTVGHALESVSGYGALRHGEAVIHGMKAAAQISALRGHLDPSHLERVESLLAKFPVPPISRDISAEKLLTFIARDKKARNGKVRFVLLSEIGKTVLDSEVTSKDILAAMRKEIR